MNKQTSKQNSNICQEEYISILSQREFKWNWNAVKFDKCFLWKIYCHQHLLWPVALELEGGRGMWRGHDPLFQISWRALTYQFSINLLLMCPPIFNFRHILVFQPCFGQNFSSQDPNFPHFRSQDPSFFKEDPLPRPYFEKLGRHTPTEKKK